MCRIIDVAALDRIQMDVLQFLSHHFLIHDLLGMTPLLPYLVLAILLVPGLEKAQPFQQCLDVPRLQVIHNLSGGEGLEIANLLGDGRRGGDQVEVIFEDYVAVDGKAVAVLEEAPGVVEELYGFGASEDG
jgi:hypothetical protein